MPDTTDPAMSATAPATLTELVHTKAVSQPDDTMMTSLTDAADEVKITYKELEREALSLASGLAALLPNGSRVALAVQNTPDFPIAFFGSMYAGLIPVPVPIPIQGALADRFRSIVADCQPDLVITSQELLPLFERCETKTATLHELRSDITSLTRPKPDDVAYLQYTSGTTGEPRGAVVTHRQACAGLDLTTRSWVTNPTQPPVNWLPLFHDLGLSALLLRPLWDGRPTVMLQPLQFVNDPVMWLREMAERRACYGTLPGFAFTMLLRRVPAEEREKLDLSATTLACSAEAADPRDMLAFIAGYETSGMKSDALGPSYGMAEVVGMVTANLVGEEPVFRQVDREMLSRGQLVDGADGIHIVGSGRPAAGVTVRIVDPDTREPLPDGSVGEILIGGPHVSDRYWQQPPRRVEMIDGVALLATGDLGAQSSDELFVLGRVAERIVVDGREMYPFDVERVVSDVVPDVRPHTCAAVAGWRGLVFLAESRPGQDQAETRAAISAAIFAEFGTPPEDVVLVRKGSIPRTTSSKVQRVLCRERYLTGTLTSEER